MKAQILKRMISDGNTLQPGDIVDVSGWRHTKTLESNRYIKIVHESVKVEKPAVQEEVVEEKPKVSKKKVTE